MTRSKKIVVIGACPFLWSKKKNLYTIVNLCFLLHMFITFPPPHINPSLSIYAWVCAIYHVKMTVARCGDYHWQERVFCHMGMPHVSHENQCVCVCRVSRGVVIITLNNASCPHHHAKKNPYDHLWECATWEWSLMRMCHVDKNVSCRATCRMTMITYKNVSHENDHL